MKRKVLIIPFVKSLGVKTRYLVAQDEKSGDWTFFSGTCKKGETAKSCALRELYEETKGLLYLRRLPKRTRQCRFRDGNMHVTIFLIPLKMKACQARQLVCNFEKVGLSHAHPEYNENKHIRFETLAQFLRRRNIWTYIRKNLVYILPLLD